MFIILPILSIFVANLNATIMENLFNLEFEVCFVIQQVTKIEPFFIRRFNDLSQADEFETRLQSILPLFKEFFNCDFSYSRLDKNVFGTKKVS